MLFRSMRIDLCKTLTGMGMRRSAQGAVYDDGSGPACIPRGYDDGPTGGITEHSIAVSIKLYSVIRVSLPSLSDVKAYLTATWILVAKKSICPRPSASPLRATTSSINLQPPYIPPHDAPRSMLGPHLTSIERRVSP